MILEVVIFNMKPGSAADFAAAFPSAEKVISSAKGYVSHTLQPSLDTPDRYILMVKWQTLENHMVDFRGSEKFVEWRAIISPFFAEAPVMEHYALPA